MDLDMRNKSSTLSRFLRPRLSLHLYTQTVAETVLSSCGLLLLPCDALLLLFAEQSVVVAAFDAAAAVLVRLFGLLPLSTASAKGIFPAICRGDCMAAPSRTCLSSAAPCGGDGSGHGGEIAIGRTTAGAPHRTAPDDGGTIIF